MASRSRSLGNNGEKIIVDRARAAGLMSSKQPGSGVFRDYPNDLTIQGNGVTVLGESKVRTATLNARGERVIPFQLDWIEGVVKHAGEMGADFGAVFVRAKNAHTVYVVIDAEVLFRLLGQS